MMFYFELLGEYIGFVLMLLLLVMSVKKISVLVSIDAENSKVSY